MKQTILLGLTGAFMSLLIFGSSATRSARQTKDLAPAALKNPYIIVDKSDYEMKVYDDEGWFATYPVVFGNDRLEDKKMEGDRQTPEGVFKIVGKKPHDKWAKFMLLDYPTQESWNRFKQRKAAGQIPKNATIGNGIGIHGTWPHEDYAVDFFMNWTNGCISMKREDVEELYRLVPIGTSITIQP